MSFTRWSVRLLESYFSPGMDGASSWISASPEELDEFGHDLGGDAGFLAAIRQGPEWLAGGGARNWLRASALALYRQWNREVRRPSAYVDPSTRIDGMFDEGGSGLDAPPFLPYLALFARVWHEPNLDGFYANLERLVGAQWTAQDLAEMRPMWDGLSEWTRKHDGRFGRFSVYQLGGYANIGLPRSQVLVTPREVTRLHSVFGRSGFRPGVRIPSAQVVAAVQNAPAECAMSTAFRAVLDAPEGELYSVAVERLMEVLEDWDGSFEDSSDRAAGTGEVGGQGDVALGVALAFGAAGAPTWSVHLHVPAVRGAAQMRVQLYGSERAIPVAVHDERGGRSSESLPSILERNETDGHKFRITDERGQWSAVGWLPNRYLRCFVREDALDAHGQAIPVLVERLLPNHGEVYFLVSPAVSRNFDHFRRLAGGVPQDVPSGGLPAGWSLVYFPSISDVSPAALEALPDGHGGQGERPRERVLLLSGGLRIRRAGVRLYLPYDLPVIEVDAPPNARVVAPGLVLEPLRGVEARTAGVPAATNSVRRFLISSYDPRRYTYRIEVRRADDLLLASAILRLSSQEGLVAAQEAVGGLGPLGEWIPRTASRTLLLGTELDGAEVPPPAAVRGAGGPAVRAAPPRLIAVDLEKLTTHPAVRFLDYLGNSQGRRAAMGRATQAAREVLERACPDQWVDIPIVYLRMRARGLIELQVDRQGRFVSLHAPYPCVYTLPGAAGGPVCAALGGAVSTDFLRRLRVATAHGIEAGVFERFGGERLSAFELPAIGLKAPSLEVLREALSHPEVQLRLVHEPSRAISEFASSLEDHVQSLDGQSTGPHAGASVETFFAPKGTFIQPGWAEYGQLYRVEDTDTGRVRLYGMKYRDGEEWKFAPVVRTWGTWHSLQLCYSHFSRVIPNFNGPEHVPIPYDPAEGALWVPASLGLPTVLERCLTLCAGQPAIELRVTRREDEPQGPLWGCESRTGGRLFQAPPFFQDYLGSSEGERVIPRTWLKYPHVPHDIAARVASLLGGMLA